MVSGSTRVAGIMAGGRGSRLSRFAASKPLALVDGKPLIEYVLAQCAQAGLTKIAVALSDNDDTLSAQLRKYRHAECEITEVPTPPGCGTGVAIHALAREIGDASCLISTVDTIARDGAYRRLIEFS